MILFLITIIILILIALSIVCECIVRARSSGIHGPKVYFLIGNVLEMLVTPVQLFSLGRKYASLYKDLYTFRIFHLETFNVYSPEDIQSVISSSKNNEKSFMYDFLRPWLGDGLLMSKGQKWIDRRKILTPTFHFNILRNFCVTIDETTRKMAEGLEDKTEKPIDVVPITTEYTLITTCETAMGTRLNSETRWQSYKKAIYEIGHLATERFSKAYMYLDFVHNFTDNYRKQKVHLDVVHKFTRNVIKERKKHLNTHGTQETKTEIRRNKTTAMLDLLIAAENQGLIDENGIQEEVDTFMFEGHDTTASALTFCLMLLANYDLVQEKIMEEIKEKFGQTPRAMTIEDLSEVRYLECCIKESLRLYPPVHFINRVITEETKIAGCTVPIGSLCNVHIYDLHRREDLFPDAEQFIPERFLPENCIGRHPYAYIPFSAGPRNCIGQRFAMLMMKSALIGILQRYKLLPVTTPKDVVLKSDLVLRSAEPIKVKFVARK